MTRIFAISGYSGSGKTTLVERIVRTLVSRGHRVATLKSSVHAMGDERESDTWRHRKAGATYTLFLDQSKTASTGVDLAEMLTEAGATDVDLLIIEGMKNSPFPKVWCMGGTDSSEELPPNTKGVVMWEKTTSQKERSLPVYTTDDLELIVETVLREAVSL